MVDEEEGEKAGRSVGRTIKESGTYTLLSIGGHRTVSISQRQRREGVWAGRRRVSVSSSSATSRSVFEGSGVKIIRTFQRYISQIH